MKFEFEPKYGVIEIQGHLTLFEILSMIGFFAIVITVIYAVKSTIQQERISRADFSFRLWESFMSDDVQRAYLEIEWNEFTYPYPGKTGFASREQEMRIDRLLYLLDEMAFLASNKVITRKHRSRWEYQGRRVFADIGIQKYLDFLDDFFLENGIKVRAHDQARRLFADNL